MLAVIQKKPEVLFEQWANLIASVDEHGWEVSLTISDSSNPDAPVIYFGAKPARED